MPDQRWSHHFLKFKAWCVSLRGSLVRTQVHETQKCVDHDTFACHTGTWVSCRGEPSSDRPPLLVSSVWIRSCVWRFFCSSVGAQPDCSKTVKKWSKVFWGFQWFRGCKTCRFDKDKDFWLFFFSCSCQGSPDPGNTKLDPCSKPCLQPFGRQRFSLAVLLVLHHWLHHSKSCDPNKNNNVYEWRCFLASCPQGLSPTLQQVKHCLGSVAWLGLHAFKIKLL